MLPNATVDWGRKSKCFQYFSPYFPYYNFIEFSHFSQFMCIYECLPTCMSVYNVQIGTYRGKKKVSTFLKLDDC